MTNTDVEKVTIIATHGPEDPERATFPFMMGNAALVMECEAVVILQGVAVLLAQKGIFEHVAAAGLPALEEQMRTFLEAGGKLLVCGPCVKERNIGIEMLIEGSELIAGARVIQEVTGSKATLNY
ncbi:MAG: DsrE family protein [Thermoleophilia bacterium]|nr:DsrE family protein [Thermoleophilia bacterium]